MSPFQIVAIVILGLGVLTALGFTIAFIVFTDFRIQYNPVRL